MLEDRQPIAELLNLGERSAQMLAAAGITSVGQLRDLGPVVAFLAIKQAGQRPSINLLWAIAAGLQNRHWADLDDEEKAKLRRELEQLTR